LHRVAKPSIVGSVRIAPHKSVVNDFVAVEDLSMYLPLIVTPNFTARPWTNGFYRKQVLHLARFEDAPLRIYERNSLTLVLETGGQML
jgi:hypothetical protein